MSVIRSQFKNHHRTTTTQIDPQPIPKLILHAMRYSTSYFKFQYILISLRSNTSFFHRRHRIPVPSIGPSKNCCWRHILNKMRPIPLVFLSFILCKRFPYSLTHCNTTPESLNQFSWNMKHGRSNYTVSQQTIWTITTVKSWKYNTCHLRIT